MTSEIEDTTSTTTSKTEAGTIHAICDGVDGAVAVGLFQWQTLADDGSIVVKTPTYQCTYDDFADTGPLCPAGACIREIGNESCQACKDWKA